MRLASPIRDIKTLMDDYYAVFPEDRERLSVLNEQVQREDPGLCNRKTLPGHLTASALVVHHPTDTCLLIHHKALKRWLQPGGHLNAHEAPLMGAIRELNEEVGELPVSLHLWHTETGIPLDIDSHVIPANANKGEPEHLHHDFMYVFELENKQELRLQFDEVMASRWVPLNMVPAGEFGSRLARAVTKLKTVLVP